MTQKCVILCECGGRISKGLDISGLWRFLSERHPGVSVVISDDLCKSDHLKTELRNRKEYSVVVGACGRIERSPSFWEEIDGYECNTYAIQTVDLLREIESPYPENEVVERVGLLLLAQMKRQEAFEGIRPENLKVRFGPQRERLNRRELLSMAMPHYEVIPSIDSGKCVYRMGCHICADTCTVGAIAAEEGAIVLDGSVCSGCGACVVECPMNAVSYPTYSVNELDKEVEGLLVFEASTIQPRIIAAVCRSCAMGDNKNVHGCVKYPSNVLPLEVPCLSMVSPSLILHAFAKGAQGFALVGSEGVCRSGVTWQREGVGFVKEILSRWGIEPKRIRRFEVAEGDTNVVNCKLREFADEIAVLGKHNISASMEGGGLAAVISEVESGLAQSSEGAIVAGRVPFGHVVLDASGCVGCCVCVTRCPTEALTLSMGEGTGTYKMLFSHSRCVACGICVESCPEECLRVERVLEIGHLDSEPTVLFEDSVCRCRECGRLMGTMSMAEKLGSRLVRFRSELCSDCAIKAEFKLEVVV